MRPRRIEVLPSFEDAFSDLTPELQEQVEKAVVHFIERTAEHALQPEAKPGLKGIWAFRVNSAYRVFYIQAKDKNGKISRIFHVGPHDDYRTVKRKRPG